MTVFSEAQPVDPHAWPDDPPAAPDSDAPLVTFDDFFGAEWERAVRLAAILTQQTATAEDLAQDAFARVFAKWSHAENPSAYLRATLVNVCRQWQRHKGVERAKLPLVATSDSVDFVASELGDAVGALPYRQRAVLVLRYYADLSEAEISAALGCRAGTVKSLASRALARLGKDLQR